MDVDPVFGEELAAQAEADRLAYVEDRERRRAEHAPRRTKEERIAATIAVVTPTLQAVQERLATQQLATTPQLERALLVVEKVIADRKDDATERLVSVHDIEARKGKKGFGAWDGRKLAVAIQEDARLVTAAVMAPANRTDDQLLLPTVDQELRTSA